MLTYAELFAGAGGMSLGLEAGGFHALAHAEWDAHARAVLRHRWPNTRLDGDVTQINGADYTGITLLSGGSPCQDLSVAGKRAGLTGSRSSLFHEQVRIWRESGAPYLLWENVGGALSSNHGADFATVLSTIVGSTVAVPADRWRGGGGVVAGRDAVAAFRVLDLQHFGPPQRRVRVFVLAARTGGVDPAEVLALAEGVCGHPSPRQQSRERVATGTGSRAAGGAQAGGVVPIDMRQVRRGATNTKSGRGGKSVTSGTPGTGIGESDDPSYTLGSEGGPPAVIAWDNAVALNISDGVPSLDDTMGTLDARTTAIGAQTRRVVMAFHHTQTPISGEVSPAIGRPSDGMGVLSIAENQHGELRLSDCTQALTSGGGKVGQGYAAVLCITGDVTHTLTQGAGATEDGTGRGKPIVARMVAFGEYTEDGTADAIKARDHKDAKSPNYDVIGSLDFGGHGGSYNGQDAYQGRIRAEAGRPRRLMPVECERLMSWPDQWTAIGRKEDGSEYALSDTARYRLCGNGVGSVCAEWIARRLHDAITAQGAA